MAVVYNGIEIEGVEKYVHLYSSNFLHATGQDPNVGTDFLDKICEYKRADVTPEQFDEINKLWSVVKMNYQICNGGIHQYFGNKYHEGWKSEDGETEIFDKDEQVAMMWKLHEFAQDVFPECLVQNLKLYRIIQFFGSLEYEEGVPQYGTVECDEDEEIFDEETGEWVANPDYEEPYEDIVDYEDEVRTTNSAFQGYSTDVSSEFDEEYYQVNEHLEKIIELYAQYIVKSIQKEIGLNVDEVVQKAEARTVFGGFTAEELEDMVVHEDYSQRVKAAECGYGLERLVDDPDARVRIAVAKQGYGLIDLMADENEFVRKTAVNKLDELNGQKARYPDAPLI